ncbi:MAG: META domain-containing protein [Pyrinomonadaceae bacterium]
MSKLQNILILTFVVAAGSLPVFAKDFPQGKWRLASYNFEQKIAFPIDQSEVTLNISPDGKLGGKTGCNVYGGSYDVIRGKLKITDIISTMMACEEPSLQFERLFTGTLLGAREFTYKDGTLTITDKKTGNFVRFRRIFPLNECPNNLSKTQDKISSSLPLQ